MTTRRKFIKTATALSSAAYFASPVAAFSKELAETNVSCQYYPWYTFYLREGKNWSDDLELSIGEFVSVGFDGFEPSFESVSEVEKLHPILQNHHLPTHSIYVNSILHDPEQSEASISLVLDIARAAKVLGIKILVTNPSPIKWGGEEDKTDEQLIIQADALDKLGAQLGKLGITLAYHNHDTEMRNSAREFHHMMLGTASENVKLCLDAHWIYRGSGNSQVALFDIVDLYVDRIVELHLRQSKGGIWTEEFTDGDINYGRLAKILESNKVNPHIVLEQAIENESPNTMGAVQAHRLGLTYANEVFDGF